MLAAESYKHFRFVGVTRLELATSRPPDAYSNQLSYTPMVCWRNSLFYCCRFRGCGLYGSWQQGCFSKAMQRQILFLIHANFSGKNVEKTFLRPPGRLFSRLLCSLLHTCFWRLSAACTSFNIRIGVSYQNKGSRINMSFSHRATSGDSRDNIIMEYDAGGRRYIKMQ